MTSHTGRSTPARRALCAAGVLAVTLAAAGCGVSVDLGSKSGSSASTTSSPSPSAASPTTDARPTDGYQVIRVKKYGVSFELPSGWTSLGSDGVITPQNPGVQLLARRLGRTPADIMEMMRTTMLTMSVSDQGAVGGFLENVNTTGAPVSGLTDDQLRLQLATVGAKEVVVKHVQSPLGEIARVTYTLSVRGVSFDGVVLGYDTGSAFVSITISAHDAASAAKRADQVQASLKLLPGGTGAVS